jgi:hypothetical protein
MQKLSIYASVIQKAELVCCAKDDGVEATISFRLNLATRGMTVERICVEPTLLRAPSHFRRYPRFFDALDDFADTAQAVRFEVVLPRWCSLESLAHVARGEARICQDESQTGW